MNRMQFEIMEEDGCKKTCDTIATYHDDEENKDYIVYTDNTFDEEQKLKIYYALYKKKNKSLELIEPKTTNEKRIGLELIKEILNELRNENK